MKYLLVLLFVLSSAAMSAEKVVAQSSMKKNTTIANDKNSLDMDPKSKEEDRADETALFTEKNPMKAHVSCKTKAGVELKAGDKGYEACLKKVKESKHDPKAEVKVEFEK